MNTTTKTGRLLLTIIVCTAVAGCIYIDNHISSSCAEQGACACTEAGADAAVADRGKLDVARDGPRADQASPDLPRPDAAPTEMATSDAPPPDLPPLDLPPPDLPPPDLPAPDAGCASPCDDSNACTFNDCLVSGKCQGTAYTCKANQCQWTSVCDGKGGCTVNPKSAGAPCDDSNACTVGDACDSAQKCVPGVVCSTPPKPSCVGTTQLKTCTKPGACKANTCEYTCATQSCGNYKTCSSTQCSGCSWSPAFMQAAQAVAAATDHDLYVGGLFIDPANGLHHCYMDCPKYPGCNNLCQIRYAQKNSSTGVWTDMLVGNSYFYSSLPFHCPVLVDKKSIVHMLWVNVCDHKLQYANNSGTNWTIKNPGVTTKTDWVVSMALDSKDGVHIAYRDLSSGADLGHTTNASGTWKKTIVASPNTGYSPSIAVDSKDNIHIVHGTSKGDKLLLATRAAGTSTWVPQTVAFQAGYTHTGRVAIGPADSVHVGYMMDSGTGSEKLYHVTRTAGTWNAAPVKTWGKPDPPRSFLVDTGGAAHMMFEENVKFVTPTQLSYASNGSGTWRTVKISHTSFPNNHGTSGRMVLQPGGKVHFVGLIWSKHIGHYSFQPKCP